MGRFISSSSAPETFLEELQEKVGSEEGLELLDHPSLTSKLDVRTTRSLSSDQCQLRKVKSLRSLHSQDEMIRLLQLSILLEVAGVSQELKQKEPLSGELGRNLQ